MGISSMAPDTPRTTETTKHQWSYPGRHEGTPTPQKLTAYKKWWWYSQKVFPLSHSLSRYAMPLFWVLKNWVYIAIEAMAHLVRWEKWWLTSQKWWWPTSPMSFQKKKRSQIPNHITSSWLVILVLSQKKIQKNLPIDLPWNHHSWLKLVAPGPWRRGTQATSDGSLHGRRAKGSLLERGSPCRRLNSCHLGEFHGGFFAGHGVFFHDLPGKNM